MKSSHAVVAVGGEQASERVHQIPLDTPGLLIEG